MVLYTQQFYYNILGHHFMLSDHEAKPTENHCPRNIYMAYMPILTM